MHKYNTQKQLRTVNGTKIYFNRCVLTLVFLPFPYHITISYIRDSKPN